VTARVSLTKRKSLLPVKRGTDKGHRLINKGEGAFHQVLMSVVTSYRE